nr:MAG TPA: tail assembly protein [Caudoviricetes sp.]
MRNRYKFFADIGGDTIEFPVNPKEYTISYPADHKTYDILDIGEIIVPRLPSLMEVSWDSYFPGNSDDPLIYGHDWMEPGDYVEAIKDAMDNQEICDLVISRYNAGGSRMYDTNISAVIADFETTEKGGEAGDVYYKIKFKEYWNYTPIKIPLQNNNNTDSSSTSDNSQRAESPALELRVGATVIANGTYYSSSYGDKPTGTANNLSTVVSRIIPDASRPYPILIGGSRGWIKADQLQVTG